MKFPYITDGETYITIVHENKTHTIRQDHCNFVAVLEHLAKGEYQEVLKKASIVGSITSYTKGHVRVEKGQLFYKDMHINSSLAMRIIDMVNADEDVTALIAFFEKLMLNPSRTSVMELYDFLEKSQLPITPEGNFLAYKKVRKDYLDHHSGTISNAVGNLVEMPRNAVDDQRDNHCSYGLHFASKHYLPHFGNSESRLLLLEIDPADVVSIPSDYDFAKGRCSKYRVLADITETEMQLENKRVVQYNPVATVTTPNSDVSPE